MVDTVTFRVDGLKQLRANILSMNEKMSKKIIRSAVVAGARIIVLAARAKAPYKYGALMKSIGSRRDIRESTKTLETRAVSVFRVPGIYADTPANVRKKRVGKTYMMDPPTFYWKFNELGTVRQPARPFVEPALYNNIPGIIQTIRNKVNDGIRNALGTIP